MPDLTSTKLLKMADDEMQILKHTGQWKETEHPGIMALKLELQQQKKESKKMVQHLVHCKGNTGFLFEETTEFDVFAVVAHWQNGIAERFIGSIVHHAQTLLPHAMAKWPTTITEDM
jgi:hypothetical protein